jgi:hypothetical protein
MRTPLLRLGKEQQFFPVGTLRNDFECPRQLATSVRLQYNAEFFISRDNFRVKNIDCIFFFILFDVASLHLLHDQICKSQPTLTGGFFLDG